MASVLDVTEGKEYHTFRNAITHGKNHGYFVAQKQTGSSVTLKWRMMGDCVEYYNPTINKWVIMLDNDIDSDSYLSVLGAIKDFSDEITAML